MARIAALCALAIWGYMTAWFVAALARKDNSLADTAWGPGFALVALLGLGLSGDFAPRRLLATALVLLWAARLAVHVFARNRGRGEDFRYAAWREKWGKWFVARSYLQVFLLQGLFLLVISGPVIAIDATPQKPLGWPDALAGLFWLGGFALEASADAQLARFKRELGNKGRILTAGLWRWSRHPNYFGEAVMWWALFFLALAGGAAWAFLASPLLITFLLRFVSGVPMLERKSRGRPDFEDYARRTNAFVPWVPRRPAPRPPQV